MLHYVFKDNMYHLRDDNREETLCSYDTISILFTTGDAMWTMHKHGDYESVLPHFLRYLEAYKLYKLLGMPYIITGKWDVDEINKVIQCSGYIETFVKKYNISLTSE